MGTFSKTLFITALAVLLVLIIISFQEQKTIKATAVKSSSLEVKPGDSVQEESASEGIPVEAEIAESESQEPVQDNAEPSPECILLSRKAQIKYEDAKEEVRELENELNRIRSFIELEEDRQPRDEAKLNQSRENEDDTEDDLTDAQRILESARLELDKLEQQCGEIIYIE